MGVSEVGVRKQGARKVDAASVSFHEQSSGQKGVLEGRVGDGDASEVGGAIPTAVGKAPPRVRSCRRLGPRAQHPVAAHMLIPLREVDRSSAPCMRTSTKRAPARSARSMRAPCSPVSSIATACSSVPTHELLGSSLSVTCASRKSAPSKMARAPSWMCLMVTRRMSARLKSASVKTAAVKSASRSSAPVRLAPCRFARAKMTFASRAPRRLAPAKLVSYMVLPRRSAPSRLAPRMSTPSKAEESRLW
mmetsp:Transcript_49472/g.165194  ORF Transcript_49472/g.165194 Transcript_49472/m.165194 type:complete len:248 (+) Transcript_49472:263-1006(+)